MNISEVFFSLQGEGIDSGLPTAFVRAAGCNLRCRWCDTRYASRGRRMTVDEILDAIAKFPTRRVCLTGGEPLHQKETLPLLRALRRKRYSVSIETNGSYDISRFQKLATISLDIKCPSSGMADQMHLSNLALLRTTDQAKFVIANRGDYAFAREIVEEENLTRRTNVIFSPVGGRGGQNLARWILRDGLDVRLGLQLHKILWRGERGR